MILKALALLFLWTCFPDQTEREELLALLD